MAGLRCANGRTATHTGTPPQGRASNCGQDRDGIRGHGRNHPKASHHAHGDDRCRAREHHARDEARLQHDAGADDDDHQPGRQRAKPLHHRTMVHDQVSRFFNGFRRDAHPMAIMVGVVGALSAFYHNGLDIEDVNHREITAIRLIAKIPTLAAWSYKYTIGQPFIYPRNDLNYAENFLHMMFATPADRDYQVNPVLARAMDRIFTLHADHEQNASTSTVRLAGSTGANPYACISAGISALWGPAHGGANEAVLKMLDEIGSVENVAEFMEKVKRKEVKLMGFGHRVYKNFDPRAKVMKQTCDEVLEALGIQDPQLALAMELERIALSDEYFIKRNLYPNVDFYSGIILKAIGIPTEMFTVIFALARTVGWISHWLEMHSGPYKIGRPRQLYTGSAKRDIQR